MLQRLECTPKPLVLFIFGMEGGRQGSSSDGSSSGGSGNLLCQTGQLAALPTTCPAGPCPLACTRRLQLPLVQDQVAWLHPSQLITISNQDIIRVFWAAAL